jgi:hypothetical protein
MSYQEFPGDMSPDPTEVPIPRGAAQYGWVWVVAIILAVGAGLYALQRQLPDTAETPSAVPSQNNPVVEGLTVPFGEEGIARISAPLAADPNSYIGIDWQLTAPNQTTTMHTAVHWGLASLANSPAGEEVEPSALPYTSMSEEYITGTFAIPAAFETNILVPEGGTIFFRVHANINGKNYWSPEQSVAIKGK